MIDTMFEAREYRPGERRHGFAQQRAGEFLSDHIDQHVGESFRSLQCHVSGKAIADDDIRCPFVNVVSFDIAIKVQRTRAQQFARVLDRFIAFGHFFANVQQSDHRLFLALYRRHEGMSHFCEA